MAEQKLNIVFTGDVSQLNKAIQSAEAELQSFENKLKDSLGTEAFASINQSIDQLRNKFKTLSTIDIKANPQQALTAINEVLTGVAKIKSSEVFLKANNKDAIAAIQQVESFARSIRATIDVGFDSSSVTAKIDDLKGKLTGLEADVSIRVSGLDKLSAEILEVKTEINSLTNKKIFIDTDISKAQDRINILEAQLLRLEKISVSPDITIESKGRVDTLAADIRKQLSTLRAEVEITADTAALDQTITNLKGKLASLEAQVKVDSVGLEQVNADLLKTRSLINTFEEIKIVVDSGDTIAEINRIEKELAELETLIVSPEVSPTQLKLFSDNIDSLKLKLSELNKLVIAPKVTGFDTSKLQQLITPLSQKVELNLNTKVAEAEIRTLLEKVRSLKGQDILINLDGTQVVKTIDAIEKELLGLQNKLKTATDPKAIAELNRSLLQLRNSISGVSSNQFTSNLNRANQATFAFSQVLREAPAFAFSFQTGLLALSNNLPILADRFKEARAAGLSVGSIFKDMAKSLLGLPGILTIASTALVFIAGAFRKSGTSAKEAAKDTQTYTEILDDVVGQMSSEVRAISVLVTSLNNENVSRKQRVAAIKELQSLAPEYFRSLNAEKATVDQITAAYDLYVASLRSAIEIRVKEKQLDQVIEKRLKLQEELNFKQSEEVVINGRKVRVFNAVFDATGEQVKKQDELNKLLVEESLLLEQIARVKPLKIEADNKGFKDATDDIISKARQFAKEFGDVFVVPDLEDSFLKTKDQILKSAQKLLDDVKNLNLTIRIPVQVESDLLPVTNLKKEIEDLRTKISDLKLKLAVEVDESEITNLQTQISSLTARLELFINVEPEISLVDTEKEIKSVTKGFFEGIKLEQQDLEVPVDINVGNIQLLEKVRKIFSDLATSIPRDLKIKLLDRESFADFDRLNEAIKQAQNNFLFLQTIGESVGEGLANAFDKVFDALREGENVFRALGEAVQDLVVQTIKAIAKMFILKAVTNLLLPGSGAASTVGKIFGSGFAGGGFNSAGGGFIGGIGGSRVAPSLSARISGTDLLFVLQQGQRIVGGSG